MENVKDVQVGDRLYRLTKTDARTSCWLFAFLADKSEGAILLSALGKCSQEEFNSIQNKALKLVSRVDNEEGKEFLVPILSGTGVIADKDLMVKPNELLDLTSESIMFNISPFLSVRE